jgi:hypothetical protein
VVWAVLNTHPRGQFRDRPDFPVPVDLQANAGPQAHDAFKRATDSRAAWLAYSAAFGVAIMDSIGAANRLAISDPITNTLDLTPRAIIVAMTALHGTITGAGVDALRSPCERNQVLLLGTFMCHVARVR